MAVARNSTPRQPYPRTPDLLADLALFPKRNPPLPRAVVIEAIREAFVRANKTKQGEAARMPANAGELAKISLQHLKRRTDPILGSIFYPKVPVDQIFEMDAVAHEMQRYRMKMGNFFQYFIIELMQASSHQKPSNITRAFDGTREGDVVADIKTPTYRNGLRLYISVKKSPDTVGGQDVAGQIVRIESIPKTDKNLTSPYLCVLAVATETNNAIGKPYEKSRKMKCKQDGSPYSDNCEVWYPDFVFPYITGWSVLDLYKEISEIVEEYLPFNTLIYRSEAGALLRTELVKKSILAPTDEHMSKEQFFQLLMSRKI